MSQIASILEILLITNKSGTAKKTGAAYSINEAHCVLRNDDGTPGAVGVLVIPKRLEDKAKMGMYVASFGLVAASYGPDQGRIVAELTDLTPVPPTFRAKPAPAPAVPAQSSPVAAGA